MSDDEPRFGLFGEIVGKQEWDDYHRECEAARDSSPFTVTGTFHTDEEADVLEYNAAQAAADTWEQQAKDVALAKTIRSRPDGFRYDGTYMPVTEFSAETLPVISYFAGEAEMVEEDSVMNTNVAGRKRIGRELRDRYIEHLGTMFEQEYINEEEFTARADKAAEARFEYELQALISDLPSLSPARPKAPDYSPDLALVKAKRRPLGKTLDRWVPVPVRLFAGMCASLAAFIPADVSAAAAYGGLGNSPIGYAALTVLGGIAAFICFVCTIFAIYE